MGLTAIMTPMRVMMTMFQIDTPSATPARSLAEACPAMATSTTDMPTLASCPIRIGHASCHKARVSRPMRARGAGADRRRKEEMEGMGQE